MSHNKLVIKILGLMVVVSMLASCGSTNTTAASEVQDDSDTTATTSEETMDNAVEAAPKDSEPITIAFWNSFTGSDADTLKAIVEDFNTQYEGSIKVEMDILASDVFSQKVPPSIATNTAPDLITLDVANLLAYARQGSIEDLSDFFTATGMDENDFLESALELGTVDEKQYGIPMQVFDSTNFFWNKDLFEAAGLDPEVPPQTFEELAEYAVKLTDTSKNQYGLGMCASAAPQFYAVFIRGNGGDVVDINTMESVLDSEANIKTFEYLHDLAYGGGVTPKSTGGVEMDNLMQSGLLAMYFDGQWLIPGLESHDINYGIAQVPSGSAGQFAILDGTLFAIPKGTDDEHKMAVYEFLKFWNSTSVAKLWSTSVGMPPYLNSVINDPEIQANETISALAENAKVAKPWLGGIESAAKINSDVLFPLIEQLQYKGDVTEMVTKASEQVDAILQSE